MISSTFKDNTLENEFSKYGIIHLRNFIDAELVEKLLTVFNDAYYSNQNHDEGMWNSLYNVSPEQSKLISETILKLLQVKFNETFDNFKAPVATFMNKNPNENGICELHRDFSILDEENYEYRNLWIPLINIEKENGALYALKGSHRTFNYPLPMFCKWPYIEMEKALFKYCEIITANAGDLIVYADRTLHGSFLNKSTLPRPVVHLGIMPEEAEITYYYLNDEKEIKIYEVPFTFFLKNEFGDQDGKYPVKKVMSFNPPELNEDYIISELELELK